MPSLLTVPFLLKVLDHTTSILQLNKHLKFAIIIVLQLLPVFFGDAFVSH